MTLWACGFVRSYDKLKSLYLHYHSVYGHKTWQMVIYLYGFLPLKSHDLLIRWFCEITWQPKIIISPLPPNVESWWLRWVASTHNVNPPFSHVLLRDHMRNKNRYISNTTISMATKLGRMVTCLDCLLPIKSNGHMLVRFIQITWQTKNISPLPQCLRP